jgi:hypothetical protein
MAWPATPVSLRRLLPEPMRFVFVLVSLLCLAGCSHYRLGTGSTPAFRTLYVAPVENSTLLPQAREILSTQLRSAFARDGRVTLANSPEAADATLTLTLNDYRREVAAVRAGDTGLARKFNLILGATATLRDRRTGQNLFEGRALTATREAFTDGGQLQSEYQALPLLADALAAKVVHATLDVW